MSEIAVAFDVASLDDAIALDETLGPGPELAKVGLELFASAGPEAVRALRARGRRVFLDLKLHDIPNTVRGAARAAGALGAELLTVHAMGGHAMIEAAVAGAAEGARDAGERMPSRIVAVTILTSFDATTIPPGFEQPFHAVLVALKLLAMAEGAGAAGIVCAAPELPALRQMHGKPFFAVTPGIRPAGAAAQDQKRVATVTEAVRAGASVLVLGRAVTSAADPRAALERARAECLAAALAEPAQP